MRLNPHLGRVATSPITEAYSWVEGRGIADATSRAAGAAPGPAFLDVSQAVPGYPPARSLREHVASLAVRDDVHGYTNQLGVAELREAFAARTRTLYAPANSPADTPAAELDGAPGVAGALGLTPDHVGITAGCNQAFCLAMAALAGPGDEVILPLPFYFNHDMWLKAQGVVPVYLPCNARQEPRLDRLDDVISERTRALVLISPNNPTGAIYADALLEEAYDRCEAAGVALVLDETYRDFVPRPADTPPHRLFDRPNWPEVLIQLFSFSKVYCLPGYRVGALVASPALLEQAAKAMDCVAICPPRLGQEAASFGLQYLDDWVAAKRSEMTARLSAFVDGMRSPEITARGWEVVSAGAYFAYVQHPFEGRPARDVARELAQRHGLLALCGEMFGPGQERFLRLAFANLSQERIPELIGRLAGVDLA